MRVLCLFVFFCFSPDLGFAQKLRSDSIVFEECSRNMNSLVIAIKLLANYKLKAINNNNQFDLLKKDLILNENKILKLIEKIKENPGKQNLWEIYELAYQDYELSLEAIKRWNVIGSKFEVNYKLKIKSYQNLRMKTKETCNGSWELGIIRKYCNKALDSHKELCKQFLS